MPNSGVKILRDNLAKTKKMTQVKEKNPEMKITIVDLRARLNYYYNLHILHKVFFACYIGMEPTNNVAERNLRPAVMARKIRQGFRSAESMKTYGIVMICALTWKARGYSGR